MFCSVCSHSPFAALARAAAKSAGARLRRLGALASAPDWPARARICARCHLRIVRAGISYCGTPFLQKLARDPSLDGCGCPCHDKAKSPDEHCPLTIHNRPTARTGGSCDCKWCVSRE